MKKPFIIYGLGDFTKMMYSYFKMSQMVPFAFCADDKFWIPEFLGHPVYKISEVHKKCPPHEFDMILTVGYSIMRNRIAMFETAKSIGYKMINYIHPTAVIPEDLDIGENNIILQSVNIEPTVRIGNNNIIWSNALLCHDSVIKSHCFLAARSLLGGFAHIEDNSFLGFNCVIKQRVKIGRESVIGAQSLVLKDCPPNSKLAGVPAKKIGDIDSATGIVMY